MTNFHRFRISYRLNPNEGFVNLRHSFTSNSIYSDIPNKLLPKGWVITDYYTNLDGYHLEFAINHPATESELNQVDLALRNADRRLEL